MISSRRFLLVFALTALAGSVPIGLSYVFMTRGGEQNGADDMARWQQKDGAIYGSFAQSKNVMKYALTRIAQVRPHVMVLGTAASAGISQEAFRVPFLNVSENLGNPGAIQRFGRVMARGHLPPVLLVPVDFTTFTAYFDPLTESTFQSAAERPFTGFHRNIFRPFFRPVEHAWDGLVDVPGFFSVVFTGRAFRPPSSIPRIGVLALFGRAGVRPDGSFAFETKEIFGDIVAEDAPAFAPTLARLANEEEPFQPGHTLDSGKLGQFRAFLHSMRERGVRVVLYRPPVAPRVLAAMREKKDFSLWREVHRIAAAAAEANGFEYHDFSDAASFGSSECEFRTAFQLGEVGSFRLVAELGRRSEVLRGLVNEEFLARATSEQGGRVLYRRPGVEYFREEVDFLGLGCAKGAR